MCKRELAVKVAILAGVVVAGSAAVIFGKIWCIATDGGFKVVSNKRFSVGDDKSEYGYNVARSGDGSYAPCDPYVH